MRKISTKVLFIFLTVCVMVFALSSCGNVEFKVSFIVDGEVYSTLSTSGKEIIKMPENPTKDGYTFGGWFWDKDVWEKPFTANSLLDAPLSSDMSVYAKFNPNHTHAYEETVTKEPTCTEKGEKTLTCACGESYTEVLNELGHDYKETVTAPTCTEQGFTTYTCSRCQDSYVDNYAEPLKHDFGEWLLAIAPTCTATGVETRYCSRDNAHTETRLVNALEHNYKPSVTAPTCTEQGYTTYTCSRCQDSYIADYVNAMGHKFTNYISDNNASYEQDGTKTAYCDNGCGEKDTITDTGSMLVKDEIIFKTLTVNGNSVYGKVPNTTANYNFLQEVETKGKAAYTLSRDRNGNEVISSKNDDLDIGDNNYYITVKVDGEVVDFYTVTVRRRPIYTVTFNTNGGTTVEKRYVEEDNFTAEPTTARAGYTFASWDYDFTAPITSSLTINSSWTANTNTPYNVEYYLENLEDTDYTLTETVNLTGTTDTMATAEIKTYEHFTHTTISESKESGNIDGNDNTVLKVFYTRDKYSYSVANENAKGGNITCTANGSYKYDKEISLSATLNSGYTFVGWFDGETKISENLYYIFNVSANYDIKAKYSANTNTPYKVEYYLENLEDTNYTLTETVNLTGTTDTTANAEIKTYEHFTPKAATVTGNIDGDGTVILKVFYTRNKYTVNISANNSNVRLNGNFSGQYKYGYVIYGIKAVLNNYLGYDEWQGWYSDNKLITAELSLSTITVDKDINYLANCSVKEEMTYFNFTSTEITCSITGIKDRTVTEITIPDYVTSIGSSAFYGCSSLTSITIGGSVTSIGGYAFYKCSGLTSITIPDSVTSIGDYAFYECSRLTSVTIPDSVTSIGSYAFDGCSGLTSITIPDSVTSIGDCAFECCSSLTSITIPDSVTSIGFEAFYHCYSLQYNEYDNAYYLGNENNPYVVLIKAKNTSIASCNMNNSTKFIYSRAFSGCSSLTSITIGGSVTSIGIQAFDGCSRLMSVNVNHNNPSFSSQDGILYDKDKTYLIYIPQNIRGAVSLSDTLNSIKGWAFYERNGLTSITIPDNVTSIGRYAFYGCSSLTSITFKGTIAQWDAIRKSSDWKYNVPSSCKVYCTNGQINI